MLRGPLSRPGPGRLQCQPRQSGHTMRTAREFPVSIYSDGYRSEDPLNGPVAAVFAEETLLLFSSLGAWIEKTVKCGLIQAGEFSSDFADVAIRLVSDFGNVCGLVVADDGRQCRAHGEAALDIRFAFSSI